MFSIFYILISHMAFPQSTLSCKLMKPTSLFFWQEAMETALHLNWEACYVKMLHAYTKRSS